MTITNVGTQTLSASATGAATSSSDSFGADFETFLTLLTTQLAQQDPLSPMDTDKFTEQLAQYSQVEQSIKTNTNLERMLESMQADRLTASLDYVGQWVELDGNVVALGDEGGAQISYELPDGAQSASVAVLNKAGDTIKRFDASLGEGLQQAYWDGLGAEGQRMPPGNYWMRVEAADADGGPLSVSTRTGGVVEGVERKGDEISLIVNGLSHALSNVQSVANRQIN